MQDYNVKPISDGQMRMIYALARKLGMEDGDRRALIESIARQTSLRACSSYEAKKIIDRMQEMLGIDKTGPLNRATKEQIGMIFALAKRLGWSEDPLRLRGFLEKRYGVSHPRFLNDTNSRNVIEAMKAMLKGGRGERRRKDAGLDEGVDS